MSVLVHAPATLSNLGPGFDVLGLALDHPLDAVRARATEEAGVSVVCAGPFGARVPSDPGRNVAAWAAGQVIARLGSDRGVALEVIKNIPPGSGLGSSAASAVAGAVATLRALGGSLPETALLEVVRDAEALAAGSAHLDNVAPALLGGFVAVVRTDPPEVRTLSLPDRWCFAVVLPHVEVRTAEARAVLPEQVPLSDAVENLRHLAALLDAAFHDDLRAFADHMVDRLAMPYRAPLLPFLSDLQEAAGSAGAPALQVSGSGPAVFAPCPDENVARRVCEAVQERLVCWHVDATPYVGRASTTGALGRVRTRGPS